VLTSGSRKRYLSLEPLSYGIDQGDRKVPSVHVQMLKAYHQEESNTRIARVTSVFEPDNDDDISDGYAEASISGDELSIAQIKDRKLDTKV